MKRLHIRLLIGALLAINAVSLSPYLMEQIVDFRKKRDSPLPSTQSGMGDLYGLTYLKKFGRAGWRPAFAENTCKNAKNIDLYLLSDSYLHKRVTEKAFCGVANIRHALWDGDYPFVQLDSQKTNILILETVERYCRVRANSVSWMCHFHVGIAPKQDINASKWSDWFTTESIKKYLFNPNINQNLDFNLFDYKPFLPLYETRAALNYGLFDRLNPLVSVAASGEYLVLTETLSGKENAPDAPISEKELSFMVDNLNEVREFYLKKGFSDVYFSIIPNPVHIVDSQFSYNNLIPKIQEHPNLKIPVINIYPIFKNNSTVVFPKNETHWTNVGMQLWINEVNKTLLPYVK